MFKHINCSDCQALFSYSDNLDVKKSGWGICDNSKEDRDNEYLCPKCNYEGYGT